MGLIAGSKQSTELAPRTVSSNNKRSRELDHDLGISL
jgi:hypothetical protein